MLEDYHLRWNEFEKNSANSFAKLRNENSFFDVTLVSNDQKQVSAHQLILSACSDTFRTIFSNNKTSNLVLYLDSLDSVEINLMLDYIYQGEVNVYQDKMDRFIQMAEKFQLNGLLSPIDQQPPQVPIVKAESVDNQKDSNIHIDTESKISDDTSLEEKYKENEDDNQEEAEILVEAQDGPTHSIILEPAKETDTYLNKTITERDSDLEDIDYEEDLHDSSNMLMNVKSEPVVPKIECSNAGFETKFQEMVVKEENFWFCTVCERTMKQRIDMKRHFENHLTGLSFDCTMCDKSFITSQAHTAHRRKNHKAEIRKYHFKTTA